VGYKSGIDLGTTYSCVGVWQNDRVRPSLLLLHLKDHHHLKADLLLLRLIGRDHRSVHNSFKEAVINRRSSKLTFSSFTFLPPSLPPFLPRPAANDQGNRTTPSYVAFTEGERVSTQSLVRSEARTRRADLETLLPPSLFSSSEMPPRTSLPWFVPFPSSLSSLFTNSKLTSLFFSLTQNPVNTVFDAKVRSTLDGRQREGRTSSRADFFLSFLPSLPLALVLHSDSLDDDSMTPTSRRT